MNLALQCRCGSLGFHNMRVRYIPSGTLGKRLRGQVDAHISGDCARCGRHVTTVIRNTREGLHDPIDLY